MKRYQKFVLAGLSGLLLIFSQPNFNLFPLAWVGLTPLLVSLNSASSWKTAFWCGYVAGAIFFFGMTYWIALLYPFANIFVTSFACAALVAYLAVYPAIFSAIIFRFPWKSDLRYMFMVPVIWTALEWVRSWMLTGFPWGSMGYSQWNNSYAIQIASITGVHGVSFIIVLLNAAIANVFCARPFWRRQLKSAALPLFIVIASFVYGVVAMSTPRQPASTIKIALVPGNVPQEEKWRGKNLNKIFNKYVNLIEQADTARPVLIVLPETAIPGAIFSAPNDYRKKLEQTLSDGQINLLIGAPHYSPDSKVYNRVFLISPNGEEIGSYSKMHLVPFGEYVPLGRYLPNLIQFKPYEPGKSVNIFPIPLTKDARMGISICFESVFPNHFRMFVKKGATVMGILTNDAWFDGTAAPHQHFSVAPFRAVENRVPVFRCANGGISCIIDSYGNVITKPIHPNAEQDFLIAQVPINEQQRTLYTRFGDWLPIICTVVCIVLLLYTRAAGIAFKLIPFRKQIKQQ
ncbi:MAG: apolipoprotein N-acyltransferase [Candidatus Poribacteria bacterium]|nr:apolipoprotein N-acyltransferase [Candidatus Poribacteria bacterium]